MELLLGSISENLDGKLATWELFVDSHLFKNTKTLTLSSGGFATGLDLRSVCAAHH